MRGVIAIDGECFAADQARVPVFDRGFLYGDSVYEVVRTYGGRPFALAEHLERLAHSAELVEIDLPISTFAFEREILGILAQLGKGDWYLRLILTRGSGPVGLDPALADTPRRVVMVLPLPRLDPALWTEGASVVLVPTGKEASGGMAAGAKTGNYLTNIMALGRARRKGAFEAIMVDSMGRISEGTTSNVFVVDRTVLRTPPLAVGILAGITRRLVIELCERERLAILQEELCPADLFAADEIFITGTLKELMPVTHVDGNAVGNALPGPLTTQLHGLYKKIVDETLGFEQA